MENADPAPPVKKRCVYMTKAEETHSKGVLTSRHGNTDHQTSASISTNDEDGPCTPPLENIILDQWPARSVSVKQEHEDHLDIYQQENSSPRQARTFSIKHEHEDHLDIDQLGQSCLKVKKSSPRPARTVSVKQEPEDQLDTELWTWLVKEDTRWMNVRPARTVSVKREPEDQLDMKRPVVSRVKKSSPVPTMTVSVKQEPEDHLDIGTDHQLTLQQDRTDELLTSKSIWIVGSSTIAQAQPRVVQTLGRHFGLPAEVTWLVKEDMLWGDVIHTVQEQLSTSPPPDILLIHAGGNDLCRVKKWTLFQIMKTELSWLHSRYENMKIVFSGIVARQRWTGARKPTRINKARISVNQKMANFLVFGAVIFHINIKTTHPGLFFQDGVQLTNQGNDIFIDNLYTGLRRLYTETH